MALHIAIPKPDGVTPEYWRVALVSIDAISANARIVLAGYISAEKRAASAQYIVDQREYVLQPQQFAALAMSEAQGVTTYDAIAGASYQFVRNGRRPADAYDQETGVATLNGVEYSGGDVVNIGTVEEPVYTVPSEFAAAENA